jgi:hypothetical protein
MTNQPLDAKVPGWSRSFVHVRRVSVQRPRVSEVLAVLLCFTFLGCGTPMAVKRLSAEQVKAQVSYSACLKAYFEVINTFADAQVQVSNFRIDRLTKDIEQEYKRAAVDQVATARDDSTRLKVLSDLANKVGENQATAAGQKQAIADLVAKLKAKQAGMLEAYQNIVSAQQKLDDYIQLQKANDVVFDELAGIVGVNRDKITQSTTDIANIENQIEKLFPVKGAPSP